MSINSQHMYISKDQDAYWIVSEGSDGIAAVDGPFECESSAYDAIALHLAEWKKSHPDT